MWKGEVGHSGMGKWDWKESSQHSVGDPLAHSVGQLKPAKWNMRNPATEERFEITTCNIFPTWWLTAVPQGVDSIILSVSGEGKCMFQV